MRNGSMFHKILQDLQMRRHFIHVSWPILHNYFVRVQVQFLVRIYRHYNVPNISLNRINTDTLYIYLYYIDKSQVSTCLNRIVRCFTFCFNQPMLTISRRLVYCWSTWIISRHGASGVRGFVKKRDCTSWIPRSMNTSWFINNQLT